MQRTTESEGVTTCSSKSTSGRSNRRSASCEGWCMGVQGSRNIYKYTCTTGANEERARCTRDLLSSGAHTTWMASVPSEINRCGLKDDLFDQTKCSRWYARPRLGTAVTTAVETGRKTLSALFCLRQGQNGTTFAPLSIFSVFHIPFRTAQDRETGGRLAGRGGYERSSKRRRETD